MKVLYLRGADLSVQLDGPALKISKDHTANRWFPLQRISRVVSSHTVDWATSALIACAQAGVSVSFLDAGQRLVARVLGRNLACESVAQLVSKRTSSPDWSTSYATWCDAMHRMALRSLVRRTGLDLDCVPSAKELRQLFYQEAGSIHALEASKRIGQQVQSLLYALVTQLLFNYGFVTQMHEHPPVAFDLCADFVEILFWDFQPARMAWLERRFQAGISEVPNDLEITEFFERRKARTEKLASGLMRRFHRWLIEIE